MIRYLQKVFCKKYKLFIAGQSEKMFADWANIPEKINPIIFKIGFLQLRWYGVLFVSGFLLVYLLVIYQVKSEKLPYSSEYISYLFIVGIISALIGGRIGYVLFYDFKYFMSHPLKIFIPFEFSSDGGNFVGLYGLSYHGSIICMILAGIFIAIKDKVNFWKMGDIIMSAAPLGYTLGRIGNFMNGELYGRVTISSWGMYFPSDLTHQLRYPSQLFEAFFEGLLLFVILWSLRKVKFFDGFIFSLYIIGYGTARFFIEYVRQPDPQLGLVLGSLTMGQVLCMCMILGGLLLMFIRFMQTRPIFKISANCKNKV